VVLVALPVALAVVLVVVLQVLMVGLVFNFLQIIEIILNLHQ
tara:strand:- start:181 stop:306 length:126 start_codon:yes stop_codon:yes gene_type:complete